MTQNLPDRATLPAALTVPVGSPTPQHSQSLSQDQLDAHREALAFDVEVILDGYWDKHPPPHVKAGILADWSDALEDWTQENALYGLRKWRNENPSKRPNPGHILAILKEMRGRAEAKRRDAAPPTPADPKRKQATQAQRDAIMAEVGVEAKSLIARAQAPQRMDGNK